MALLARPWALHDVEDAEALCSSVIGRSGLDELSYHDREDLLAYLLALVWELSLKWDPPAKYRRKGFAVWATTTLRLRVIDWQRSPQRGGRIKWQFAGSTYERTRPTLVSLDADGAQDALGTALAGSSLDRDPSGFASDMRALAARGRRPGGRDKWLGDEAA